MELVVCPFVCPEQFVLPHVCTALGQRNKKVFELARACKAVESARSRELAGSELSRIFESWWGLSKQFIKQGKHDCVIRFIDLVRRKVRFLPGVPIFQEAERRARSLPLPDIGVEHPALRHLAALTRELQRAFPDTPFFCSVETARIFADLPSKGEAHRCLLALEQLKVIECVKRGIPGKPKATRYRYLLPLDQ